MQIAIDANKKDRDAQLVAKAAEERRRIESEREEANRQEVIRKQQEAEAKRRAEEERAKQAVAALEGLQTDMKALQAQNEQLRAAADSAGAAEQKLVEVLQAGTRRGSTPLLPLHARQPRVFWRRRSGTRAYARGQRPCEHSRAGWQRGAV